MNKTNIDQALAALADALKSQEPDSFSSNPQSFIEKIPKRSLSGDLIYGGKILKFASGGVTDTATKQQISIDDSGVKITTLQAELVSGDLNVEGTVSAKTVKADVLEVKELKADIKFEKNTPITFNGPGKGLLWITGKGYNKQLVYVEDPDRFFLSESLDLQKEKYYSINNVKVLGETELGTSVVKSNLKEVGALKGLIVNGSVNIGSHVFYNADTNKLGIGTSDPKSVLTIVEDGVELVIGSKENAGILGTYASQNLDLVTDNTPRVTIAAGGNIHLGNNKTPPVQVSVHGKLAIKVNMPDPEVDLHVNGAVKFCNRLQKYDRSEPTVGTYNQGDIVWNIEPKINGWIGWVCVQAGTPGVWAPFGKIGS
jgi:hypothetical protein